MFRRVARQRIEARPEPRLMFGIEFLSGGRRDKDDAEGTDNRLQLSSQFSF